MSRRSSIGSDDSDDSFEVVSPDIYDDELKEMSINSFKPQVKFNEMYDAYPLDSDIVSRISFDDDFVKSEDDKVIVLPVAWTSVDQTLCSGNITGSFVRFDVRDLPKNEPDKYYQLCYCSKGRIVGISTPFSFREVREDELIEFHKNQNKDFWTFRSRFAVLMDMYWNALVKNVETENKDSTTETEQAMNNVEECKHNLNSTTETNQITNIVPECKADMNISGGIKNEEIDNGKTSKKYTMSMITNDDLKCQLMALESKKTYFERAYETLKIQNELLMKKLEKYQSVIIDKSDEISSVPNDSSTVATDISIDNVNEPAIDGSFIAVPMFVSPQQYEFNLNATDDNKKQSSAVDAPDSFVSIKSDNDCKSFNLSASRFMVTETGNVLSSKECELVHHEFIKKFEKDSKMKQEDLLAKITELHVLNNALQGKIEAVSEELIKQQKENEKLKAERASKMKQDDEGVTKLSYENCEIEKTSELKRDNEDATKRLDENCEIDRTSEMIYNDEEATKQLYKNYKIEGTNEMKHGVGDSTKVMCGNCENFREDLYKEFNDTFLNLCELIDKYEDQLKKYKDNENQTEKKNEDSKNYKLQLEDVEIQLRSCVSEKEKLAEVVRESKINCENYRKVYQKALERENILKQSLELEKNEKKQWKSLVVTKEAVIKQLNDTIKQLEEERDNMTKKEDKMAEKLVTTMLENRKLTMSLKTEKEKLLKSFMEEKNELMKSVKTETENQVQSSSTEKDEIIKSLQESQIDLNNRLKEGAKEYAKLYLKYTKHMKSLIHDCV